jgi:hypothetical protein
MHSWRNSLKVGVFGLVLGFVSIGASLLCVLQCRAPPVLVAPDDNLSCAMFGAVCTLVIFFCRNHACVEACGARLLIWTVTFGRLGSHARACGRRRDDGGGVRGVPSRILLERHRLALQRKKDAMLANEREARLSTLASPSGISAIWRRRSFQKTASQ